MSFKLIWSDAQLAKFQENGATSNLIALNDKGQGVQCTYVVIDDSDMKRLTDVFDDVVVVAKVEQLRITYDMLDNVIGKYDKDEKKLVTRHYDMVEQDPIIHNIIPDEELVLAGV